LKENNFYERDQLLWKRVSFMKRATFLKESNFSAFLKESSFSAFRKESIFLWKRATFLKENNSSKRERSFSAFLEENISSKRERNFPIFLKEDSFSAFLILYTFTLIERERVCWAFEKEQLFLLFTLSLWQKVNI